MGGLAAGVGGGEASCVADLGAGPGHHLAAVLEALPRWAGVALDASRPALRRAARAHPRIAAVGCDVWAGLPLADGAAGLVTCVFAPRNAAEIARVLAPDGALIVVVPAAQHLVELRRDLGLLDVDPAKGERLHAALAPRLAAVDRRDVAFGLELGRAHVRTLAAMGPSAHHMGAAELGARVAGLPERVRVTVAVRIETFRPVAVRGGR